MDVFLEVAPGLRGSYRIQLVDRGLQKLGHVLFNLLADAGLLQSCQEVLILNVGESAAQRTFHDVVVDHGVTVEIWRLGTEKGRSSRLSAAGGI